MTDDHSPPEQPPIPLLGDLAPEPGPGYFADIDARLAAAAEDDRGRSGEREKTDGQLIRLDQGHRGDRDGRTRHPIANVGLLAGAAVVVVAVTATLLVAGRNERRLVTGTAASSVEETSEVTTQAPVPPTSSTAVDAVPPDQGSGPAGNTEPSAAVTTPQRPSEATAAPTAATATTTESTPDDRTTTSEDLLAGLDIVDRGEIRFAAGTSSAVVADAVIRGQRNLHTFDARGGQTVTLTITSIENNAVLDLLSPDGTTLARGIETVTLDLPRDGIHQIIVGGTRGNASYDLRLEITG